MTEMFATLGTWNWLIFGVILMALELLAPGVFLFWLGLAALLVVAGQLHSTGAIKRSPKEALQPFNLLIGQWKGTGTPEGTAAIEPLSAVRPGLLSLICYCPSRRRC